MPVAVYTGLNIAIITSLSTLFAISAAIIKTSSISAIFNRYPLSCAVTLLQFCSVALCVSLSTGVTCAVCATFSEAIFYCPCVVQAVLAIIGAIALTFGAFTVDA